jgi:hypothetical protein
MTSATEQGSCVHPWCGKEDGEPVGAGEIRVPYKTKQLFVRVCVWDLNICFIYDVPKLCNTESHIKSFWTSLLLFPGAHNALSVACCSLAFKSHEIQSSYEFVVVSSRNHTPEVDEYLTYVRMYVHTYVCMYVYMHVGIHACKYVHAHVWLHS